VRDTPTYWVDFAGPGEAPRKTNAHDHDQEAEGDLQDPEVSEGDRPQTSEPPTLEAPAATGESTAPVAPAPSATQNAPK